MDDTEGNSSMDSVEVGPSSPGILVTPRLPILVRESPLSTKREKSKMTPRFRRPQPKVVKTAPPVRSFYHSLRDPNPRMVGLEGITTPLFSPRYNPSRNGSFFEQTFTVVEVVGKGSFGEVFKALCHDDNRLYAVKVSIGLLRYNCSTKYREVENHMSLPSHYNLVRFIRAWEQNGRLYIQTELCQMSLLTYCSTEHFIPERILWNIIIDLIRAIHHLHSHDMIHDDIKPDNIFLTADMVCKLGDFGLAINLKNPIDVMAAEEGDSKYLAPEVLNGKPTKASDIFSLGMTILEAATDLDVPSNGQAWHSIREGEIPDRFFVGCSTELRGLIGWMLNRDPSLRPTTQELLDFPAVKKRLMMRHLFIKSIDVREYLTNMTFLVMTWAMAFFAVLFQHPIAMFQAVSLRRTAICAKMSNGNQLQNQQHTPIQTPEASKVFAESLVDNTAVMRSQQAPFDFSDDENSASTSNIQRRLFENPVSKLNFDDDDDDDEEQATSSSNSSAIESTSSPVRDTFRDPNDYQLAGRIGTPKSARRIVLPSIRPTPSGTSPSRDHGGSGDAVTNEERAAWMSAKYQRMRMNEARFDSADHDGDTIDETPLMHAPLSCPPLAFRQGRRFMKAPRLDFSMLDDKDDKEKEEEKKAPEAAPEAVPTPKSGRVGIRRPIRMTRARVRSLQNSSGDEI